MLDHTLSNKKRIVQLHTKMNWIKPRDPQTRSQALGDRIIQYHAKIFWIILSPKAWERVCGSLGVLPVMIWIEYDPRCLWDPKKLSNKDL